MPFTDRIEKLIEKSVHVLDTDADVIKEEFTRFNTIYVGNIKKDRVTFELLISLTMGSCCRSLKITTG
jgi:hypothetical protein